MSDRPEDQDDRSGDIDGLWRTGAPADPDAATVDRVVVAALERLHRRHRRRRIFYVTVGAAALLVLSILVRSAIRPEEPAAYAPSVVERVERPASADRIVAESIARTVTLEAARRESLVRLREAGPSAIPMLAREIVEGGDEERAVAAAGLLVALRREAADETALRLLESVPRDAVTHTLLRGLLDRGDRSARRTIERGLARPGANRLILAELEEPGTVRREEYLVTAALGRDVEVAARAVCLVSARSPRQAVALLLKRLSGMRQGGSAPAAADSEAPAFLAAALPALGEPARRYLAARAARTGDATWPAWLAEALARSGVEEAWPILAALFERGGAAPALIEAAGELGDPRAVPLLERWVCLADRRGTLAIEALERIDGSASTAALFSIYESGTVTPALLPESRLARVAAALSAREHDVGELIRAAAHNTRLSRSAATAYATLFPEAAVRDFSVLLFEVPVETKALCVHGLMTVGTPDAVVTLLRALDEPSLRRLAHGALVRIARRDLGRNRDVWTRWFEERLGRREEQTSRSFRRSEWEPAVAGAPASGEATERNT